MRRLSRWGAMILGVVGTVLCAAAIGLGFWGAAWAFRTIDLVVAARNRGLTEAERRLTAVETRLAALRADIAAAREAAEKIVADDADLPRAQAVIEKLLERLTPALERTDAAAELLGSAADGLRMTTNIAAMFGDDPQATARRLEAADRIAWAAAELRGLRAKLEAILKNRAVQAAQELVALAGRAVAGSERLAEGLEIVRRELAAARDRDGFVQARLVGWVRLAALVNSLVWLWVGAGQVCLVGWGRRGAVAA